MYIETINEKTIVFKMNELIINEEVLRKGWRMVKEGLRKGWGEGLVMITLPPNMGWVT